MIEVTIRGDSGLEIGRVRIEELSKEDDGWSRYSAEFAVDRGGAVGLHRQSFSFNTSKGNPLGLLKVALDTLTDREMESEDGEAGSPDMAGGLRGIESQVQAWTGEVHHHRPSFWGGQPE